MFKVELCSRTWASCQDWAKCNKLVKANNCEMLLHYLDTALRQTSSSNFSVWAARLQKLMERDSAHQELCGVADLIRLSCVWASSQSTDSWIAPENCYRLFPISLLSLAEALTLFTLERVETDGIDSLKCLEQKTNVWAAILKKKGKKEKPL